MTFASHTVELAVLESGRLIVDYSNYAYNHDKLSGNQNYKMPESLHCLDASVGY